MDLHEDRPWYRRPGEPEVAFLYFRAWLTRIHAPSEPQSSRARKRAPGLTTDAARSVDKTAKHFGVSSQTVQTMSAKWKWKDRAQAYDNHLLAKRVAGELDTIEEHRTKQAELLSKGTRVLHLSLDLITRSLAFLEEHEESGDAVEEAEKLASALGKVRVDLPKLLDKVLHYQNLLYGEHTESVKVQAEFADDWDLSALSDDELRALVKIKAKIRVRQRA